MARVIFGLQLLGSVLGILIGAARADGRQVLLGFAGATIALVLFSISGLSMSSETVDEVRGPQGQFVVRTSRQKTWRDYKGTRRFTTFVVGKREWVVTVRRRSDDPFGPTVLVRRIGPGERPMEVADAVRRSMQAGGDATQVGPGA